MWHIQCFLPPTRYGIHSTIRWPFMLDHFVYTSSKIAKGKINIFKKQIVLIQFGPRDSPFFGQWAWNQNEVRICDIKHMCHIQKSVISEERIHMNGTHHFKKTWNHLDLIAHKKHISNKLWSSNYFTCCCRVYRQRSSSKFVISTLFNALCDFSTINESIAKVLDLKWNLGLEISRMSWIFRIVDEPNYNENTSNNRVQYFLFHRVDDKSTIFLCQI